VQQTWRKGVRRIKVMVLPVPFSFHKARRTPHSSAWLPKHLHTYSLNFGLSVLDGPDEVVYLFVLAMGEGDLAGTIPRFFERISYVASTGQLNGGLDFATALPC